jgi:hypothetical protein
MLAILTKEGRSRWGAEHGNNKVEGDNNWGDDDPHLGAANARAKEAAQGKSKKDTVDTLWAFQKVTINSCP